MAVAEPAHPRQDSAPRIFVEAISALWSIQSVKQVFFTEDPAQIDLWIVMDRDHQEDAERIYRLERDFLEATDLFLVEFHVVSLEHVAREHLPEGRVLFERAG